MEGIFFCLSVFLKELNYAKKKEFVFFFYTVIFLWRKILYNLELESKKKNIGKFDDAGIDKNLIF